ncbi:PP2C family protein-serine/threonine phosphatase [Streptomyces sp. NPDC059524]|uniref:PP2C family protein-serine/threonine phosphatase n=1 Tax=Streptomyces sp. NPDC059524 TaxID=3346856 RepID=UPI0036880E19
MSPHVFADRPAGQPPERGTVDSLISQTRRLLGDVDAVRRDAVGDAADPEARWQRALYELAVHQLSDLDRHLAQLREGPALARAHRPAQRAAGSLLSRVGSAEWDLLTDEASWSEELFQILGRDPSVPALTLDELPSVVHADDQPKLTSMVTDCLIDGKPIDGEFRVVRPDGSVRTVHMMGEPVLDADGATASMWAVVRDVSELRRSQRTVRETRDSLRRRRPVAPPEPQEAAPPAWRGSLQVPRASAGAPGGLDIAALRLPAATGAPSGGDWYDALGLTDGATLLSVGDLPGRGAAATADVAMLLGAARGMALCATDPAGLLSGLNHLLDTPAQPRLGSALCCRYDPVARVLTWASAGHPAPLLFRDGAGRALTSPAGSPLGAPAGTAYGQAEETLRAGDLLLLHTDGLVPRRGATAAAGRLLALAPRLTAARDPQECLRMVSDELGGDERENDGCVLVARVGS